MPAPFIFVSFLRPSMLSVAFPHRVHMPSFTMSYSSAPTFVSCSPLSPTRIFCSSFISVHNPFCNSLKAGGFVYVLGKSLRFRTTTSPVLKPSPRQTPRASGASSFEISVKNESSYPKNFFIFQQEPLVTGELKAYSNSLGMGFLPAYHPLVESHLSFSIAFQLRAGAQKLTKSFETGELQTGKLSLAKVMLQAVEDKRLVVTKMSIDEHGMPDLSPPARSVDVPNDSFRIVTPTYPPEEGPFLVGTAVAVNGILKMSNFISAVPAENMDVQPIFKFYVATGKYYAGQVISYSWSSVDRAVCDATSGQTKFMVIYREDGTFHVLT